jgi:hypothetical protein
MIDKAATSPFTGLQRSTSAFINHETALSQLTL